MLDIVDAMLAAGAIPVMSTIPPRDDSAAADARVPLFNAIVRGIAQGRGVPLVDFHRALVPLTEHGLGGGQRAPQRHGRRLRVHGRWPGLRLQPAEPPRHHRARSRAPRGGRRGPARRRRAAHAGQRERRRSFRGRQLPLHRPARHPERRGQRRGRATPPAAQRTKGDASWSIGSPSIARRGSMPGSSIEAPPTSTSTSSTAGASPQAASPGTTKR
jgi:hypothetical protein